MALARSAVSGLRSLACVTQLVSTACSCSTSGACGPPSTSARQEAVQCTRLLATRAQNPSVFAVKPESLYHERLVNHTPAWVEENRLLKSLLQLTGYYSRKSDLAEGATVLYDSITELLDNERVYEAFGLDRSNFMSGFSILSLHVWLLVNRLRGQGPDAKFVMQLMYDTFQQDVERRVYRAGVEMHLKKWVRKLEGIFYGTSVAYDKAVRGEGGTTLPDALLKNVYGGDIAHLPHAHLLARYLLREAECLQLTSLEDVLKGQVQFSADRLLPREPGSTSAEPQMTSGLPVSDAATV